MTGKATAETPRKLPKDARRIQLIEATIETLARLGYARTTLSDVARIAGLSHGLINFHFQSKQGLLLETLLHLAEEYRLNWLDAVNRAGPHPAERIEAMLGADFNPAICTQARLSAWCAFWGEAQNKPMYQEHCGSNDEAYQRTLEGFVAQMIADHGYSGDPRRIARVLRVTTEGVWLDFMTMSSPYDLAEGRASVMTCAAAFFPRHFDAKGAIRLSA